MEGTKGELLKVEKDLHDRASEHFKENDKNIKMGSSEKGELFEDVITDFKQSLALINKKFSVIDKKVDDLG